MPSLVTLLSPGDLSDPGIRSLATITFCARGPYAHGQKKCAAQGRHVMEFKILGPIGACSSGEEISLHGAKQRTVLAALLLNRQRLVSDSRLGELLWGESLPATFSAQIYTYVSRLRKCLGKAVEIVRRPPPGGGPDVAQGPGLLAGSRGRQWHRTFDRGGGAGPRGGAHGRAPEPDQGRPAPRALRPARTGTHGAGDRRSLS